MLLFAAITPAEYMGDVEWSSSDETIATVDRNGIITAIEEGEVTITVKTADGTVTYDCAVTVTEPPYEIGDVNKDGSTTVSDALAVLKYVAQIDKDIDLDLADCDGVEGISVSDALWILKKVAQLI